MPEGLFKVNVTVAPAPEGGVLPVPAHPTDRYRVPAGPAAGEGTDAVMPAPASNHPLNGLGGPKGEVTLK